MKVAHLGVFLHVECVIHITANAQAQLVHCDDSISLRTLENMQFNQILLAGGDDSELTETHLEHHVFTQEYFLSHHDESPCGRSNVSQVEF